jgi:hypothetical protein
MCEEVNASYKWKKLCNVVVCSCGKIQVYRYLNVVDICTQCGTYELCVYMCVYIYIYCIYLWKGTAVAQRLRYCATNRKVAGSIPDGVIGIWLGGPQGRSGQVREISLPPGFDPRTVQPVVSRYTD